MNYAAKPMKPRILVTGANGFVGGWFAEAIHLAGWGEVRAGLSRWSGAARIARFPIELCLCDVMDRASLDAALLGVDVVIHCARGRADDSPVTTDGTKLLLDRARAAGVRKVIFMSSVAVYGDAVGEVAETTTPPGELTAYGASKRQAEAICADMADDDMQVVALRPTLIYGPFSEQWSMPYIRRLVSGRWKSLDQRGLGRCNLVYVGDLVHFARHLLSRDTGPYAVFNANGPEIPTWNDYIERFNELLGLPPLQPAGSMNGLGVQVMMRRPVRFAGKYMLNNHRELLLAMAKRSPTLKGIMKRTEEDLRLKPNDDELERFSVDVTYSMKAAANIGFVPPTGVERGLALTAGWARDLGLVA